MSRELQTKTGQPLRKPPGAGGQSVPQQSSASLCAGKVPAWRPTGHQTSHLSSPHWLWPSSIGILQMYWAFCLQMSGMPGSAFAHKFMNSKFLASKKSLLPYLASTALFLWITWHYWRAIHIKFLSKELHFWVKAILKFLFPKHTTYFNILIWTLNYWTPKTIFLPRLAKMH